MHRGPKPAAQPRSLRSIAEGKNAPANFVDSDYDAQAGIPANVRGAGQTYSDRADAARVTGGQQAAADPKPTK